MSLKAGRIHNDPIPGIRAAGKIIAMGEEGTGQSIKHDYNLNHLPGTPEHIKKYRKTF